MSKPIGKARAAGRLAAAVAIWVLLRLALLFGLGAAFRALFAAWNVTAENARLAPGWARALFVWHGSAVTLAADLAGIALCVLGFRVRVVRPKGTFWALPGAGCALAPAALFLLTDSLRPLWPLSAPRLSWGLVPLMLSSLAAVLAGALLSKGVIFETVKAQWGAIPAIAAAALAFFLGNGGLSGTVVSGINVALMGLLCAAVYARRGLWAEVALRWGWSVATAFLLGNGGGDHAVYRLYGVSENLLTGGDAGLVYGLWLTLMLAAALCAMWVRGRQGR